MIRTVRFGKHCTVLFVIHIDTDDAQNYENVEEFMLLLVL